MKRRFLIFPMALLWILTLVWHGCEADVNLNDIDTSVKVDANVAVPIGSIKATIGDFIGDGTWGIYVDSLRNKGVLTFRDTFSISRNFHHLDLSQYISKTSLTMNVHDQLESSGLLIGGSVVGTGVTIPISFPLTMKLNGINNNESYQRLDSALIRNASFTSSIGQLGGLPLQWEWIEKVTLTLGSIFNRQDGNVLDIYTKGDGYGYGQSIPINVDEFSMNLMKNTNPIIPEAYSNNNVLDSCEFVVTMYVNIPVEAGTIAVPSTAAFQYNLDVQFIDYHAIWGMFQASGQMSNEQEIALGEEWDAWKLFEAARLPFADPKLNLNITTQIAGALMVKGDYLYVKDKNGQQINATFDGSNKLYKYFNPNEYLSVDSEIGDSTTMHVLFDKDPARGHIDKLFSIHPDYLGYKFDIDFNRAETPQIRITNNTSIRIDAECEMPFMFNEGVKLAFSDTINNINLSMITLDSLMANIPDMVDTINDATLTLALRIENSIPLQLKGTFVCLDENDNVILDPKTGKPLLLVEQDTLTIPTPDHQFNPTTATWDVTPAELIKMIEIEKDDLNTIAQIKKIMFSAILDDESLDYAYNQGHFNVRLTEYESLRIKLGVGADIEAILNLDSFNE